MNNKNYSQKQVYKNGNKVIIGDHTEVRSILAGGIVHRVSNFGPLLAGSKFIADKVIVSDDFELHVKHEDESNEFGFTTGFVTIKDTNLVYYQRISI